MEYVYIIKQHQEDSEYNNYLVDVFKNEEKALKQCNKYNDEYGNGEKHYYTIITMEVKK